jgi:glyceraldehyde-3-phosphate dehydrogenase (NAD(P))
MNRRVRVGINGYGVIDKRVADAVTLQDDMALVGVADVVHDYRIRVAVEHGHRCSHRISRSAPREEAAGIPVVGALDDLIAGGTTCGCTGYTHE